METKYLRKIGQTHLFGYNDIMAQRNDMEVVVVRAGEVVVPDVIEEVSLVEDSVEEEILAPEEEPEGESSDGLEALSRAGLVKFATEQGIKKANHTKSSLLIKKLRAGEKSEPEALMPEHRAGLEKAAAEKGYIGVKKATDEELIEAIGGE